MIDKSEWALTAFENASKILLQAQSQEELISGVCREITQHHPYVLAWVGIPENDANRTVRILGVSGEKSDYAKNLEISWDHKKLSGQGPSGVAIQSGKIQVMLDTETESRFAPWLERARTHGIRSGAAIPILSEETVIGLLVCYASIPDNFSHETLRLFQSLANVVGTGLMALNDRVSLEQEKKERETAQKQLIKSLEMTIGAMATAMEMRDPYTSGHQSQVAKLTEAIAREMGWEEEQIQGLRMAAMVHDIGKLAIPTDLLTKPSKLSPVEYSFVKEHVNSGYSILKNIPFTQPVAEVVRQHHELMDGSGYPRGLKGDEILPEARVLAVANIINSLCSHRPYRAAVSLDQAIQELLKHAGKKLDVEVVQSAKRLFDRQVLQRLLI